MSFGFFLTQLLVMYYAVLPTGSSEMFKRLPTALFSRYPELNLRKHTSHHVTFFLLILYQYSIILCPKASTRFSSDLSKTGPSNTVQTPKVFLEKDIQNRKVIGDRGG